MGFPSTLRDSPHAVRLSKQPVHFFVMTDSGHSARCGLTSPPTTLLEANTGPSKARAKNQAAKNEEIERINNEIATLRKMLAHGSLTESKKKVLQQQLAEFDGRLAALTTGKGNTSKDDVPRALRDARLGGIDLAKISVKGKGKERDDTGTEQRTLTDATKTPES
jgi:hypothetical protein